MHRNANRFKLVRSYSYCRSYLSLMRSIPVARRRRSGVDVYARSGDDTWGSQRGMISDVGDHATF